MLAPLLLILSFSAQAQSLLPIPQAPSTPTLPLPINTDGYFVFSWPSDTMGTQQAIVATNPPVEVRSGVVKVGTWSYGTWFLKSNGEVVLYFNQGPAGAAPTKVNLPSFFKTNISQLYLQGSLMVGVSSSGQMGVMSGTDIGSFYQPFGGTNVVEALIQGGIGPEGFLTLHSDGKIRCWSVENTNISITNHIASQLENVKLIDGTASCGLAISENGQVYGWSSYPSIQLLPIPYAASSGVVQVSAPQSAATDSLFYALKDDGSIVLWDLQGSQFVLPSAFTGKQFVQVLGIGSGMHNTAFALTRQGELVGWKRLSNGMFEILTLQPPLTSGIKHITWINQMGVRRLIALNNQGGILPVSDLGPSGWGVDGSVPYSIASRGGTLNSIVLGSGAGATGPSNYSLSTDGDLAVQTYAGLPLDILAKLVAERIVGTPGNFGLSTQSSINSQVSNSLTQMVSATLATKTELSNSLAQSRSDGINSVISNPNLWTLYTTNQIKAMVMGDLMLTRTNNGQFVLNYDIEQSDDLSNWAPYAGYALPLTNLPTDKAFVRIKLKNQQ